MPSILIEVRKHYSKEQEIGIIEAVRDAFLQTFQILPGYTNIRFLAYEPHRFECSTDHGSSDHYVHISIDCFVGRSLETKRHLYQAIVNSLGKFNIPKDQTKIVLRENSRENFGIRGGQAASDVELPYNIHI